MEVVAGWSHGDANFYDFVTPDHRHFWVNHRTWKVGLEKNPIHYTSCDKLFPDEMDLIAQEAALLLSALKAEVVPGEVEPDGHSDTDSAEHEPYGEQQ